MIDLGSIYKWIKFEIKIFSIVALNRANLDEISLNENFGEVLQEVRKAHKKYKRLSIREFFIAIFTCVICPILIFYFNEIFHKHKMLIMVCFPLIVFIFWIHLGKMMLFWNEYTEIYKQKFIAEIVKDINQNFSYKHQKIDDFDKSFIDDELWRYHYTHKEDFIKGKYKNISFELAEFHDYENPYASIKGVIMSCEFYKDFKFNLKIANRKVKEFENSEILDNVEFNQIFSVKGEDKVEIRYLLSPSFMQRLINLSHEPNFGIVSALFKENKFYLYIENNKDLFEPYLFFAPNLNLAKYYKMEILNFLSLIDELNLTLNIYPKTVLKNQKLTR